MKKLTLLFALIALNLCAWAEDTYTPVEYIATTTSMKDGDSNDNVPYINTGYVHKANTKIEMECAITAEQKNWEALFGTRNGNGNTKNGAFVFFWRTNGSNVGCYNRGDGEKAGSNSIPKDVRIKVLANPGSVTIKKVSDNSDVTTISTPEANASDGASHKPIYIFDTNTTDSEGLHPDGSRSYMKLYNFRIYEGDDLVHYYVPVKRNNDKPGLYDLKTGSFVTSETSKDFDAGTTVQTFTTWSTGDAILPSIKYGGSYSAYTWTKASTDDFGDWNANNSHYNQLVGTPGDDSNEKKWYDVDYQMPTSSAIDWQFGNSVLPGNWATGNKYGDVYVRRYFIIKSGTSLPGTIYMPTPHDDAPCEYYINGTLIWSRTGAEPGVDGWYEDEVVRLTDAQKALIKTDGTVNVFAFHVHQNWGGRYADGGLYGDAGTDNTPSKKFNDDTNRSRLQTVFNTFSVSDFTTWYGISSATAEKAKAACNYRQDASYYFDQLFPSALNTRINTAKAIKELGKNSTSGESALNTAISTAEGAVSAANKDNYVSALTALNTAINAAVIDIKQNQAETSPQPTIFTMISGSVVGTDDNNYGTIVNDRADGFYIYNVGTGRWFCGGDDWGAHAAVGFPGIKVTTPKNDYVSGHYNSVVTWLCNGNWGTKAQLNHSGYCDTDGNGWKFFKQNAAQGIYTWARNGDNTGNNSDNGYGTKDLVGFAPSTYARVNTDRTGADDPYNQWIFVTEAQRDQMAAAAMATASESNPVDLTYKIKMPGFNQRERKEGTDQSSEELDWTCNHANYLYNDGRKIIMGRGDNHADFVCDIYGVSWNDAFSWTQTIEGLQPGRYRVKVQGYNNGGSDANKACLVANGQKVALVERSSEAVLPWTTKLPENTFDNPEYFQVGCYWNEVYCTVGSDGELTLGIESPSVTGSHVIIFDNFRLEYVGGYREMNENDDNSGINETAYVVKANRTLKADKWNTFCVPFPMTAAQISSQLGEGAEVKTLTGITLTGEHYAMSFADASTIEAGKPYLVKVADEVTSIEVSDAGGIAVNTTSAPAQTVQDGTGSLTYHGVYTSGMAPRGSFIISNNMFYNVDSDVTLKAFRGYITVDGSVGVKALDFFFDDDATSLGEELRMKNDESEGSIYNLGGQQMSKVQKGVNIVNGKKVLF